VDPLALKQRVIEEAHRLGFEACRIAPAQAAPHREAFLQWLADGFAGEMQWMGRDPDRRTQPDQVLPGARSVIMVAKSYHPSGASPLLNASFQIARYASGEDYHEVLTPRLRELEKVLAQAGGSQRSYVDTGPILERDFAALAGLGWQGKSTMLISKNLGTFFFLGALLTTLELPPDAPAKDHCGRCQRCIDVCPTRAIIAPHRLNATRCVAYLTIELKGSIPVDLRPLIGNRIYGCDDCAAVCPWNRFASASQEIRFQPGPFSKITQMRDFLELDEPSFRELFRGSPIKRIKRRGFLRNVCVALGNTGGPEDLEALQRIKNDPEPLIAEHAQWAIEQITRRLDLLSPGAGHVPAPRANDLG
jgi:epoxyqueuosine reductase